MLLLGNFTIASGVGHYYGDILDGDDRKVLGPLSLITFCLLVAMFEAIYRIRNTYAHGHVKTPASKREGGKAVEYTADLVDKQVAEGRPLVIFDNLVLDLNGY
jgi:hypothetical protein